MDCHKLGFPAALLCAVEGRPTHLQTSRTFVNDGAATSWSPVHLSTLCQGRPALGPCLSWNQPQPTSAPGICMEAHSGAWVQICRLSSLQSRWPLPPNCPFPGDSPSCPSCHAVTQAACHGHCQGPALGVCSQGCSGFPRAGARGTRAEQCGRGRVRAQLPTGLTLGFSLTPRLCVSKHRATCKSTLEWVNKD